MISHVLLRKLLLFAAYSAAVTALPVMAAPLVPFAPPVLHADEPRDCECDVCPVDCDCPCMASAAPVAAADDAPGKCAPWWCRGPVRRGVRAVALFVSRPWRK